MERVCDVRFLASWYSVLYYSIYIYYIISTNITNRSTNQCQYSTSWCILIHPDPSWSWPFRDSSKLVVCWCLLLPLNLGAQFRAETAAKTNQSCQSERSQGKALARALRAHQTLPTFGLHPNRSQCKMVPNSYFVSGFVFSTPLHALHCSAVVRFSMDFLASDWSVSRQKTSTTWHYVTLMLKREILLLIAVWPSDAPSKYPTEYPTEYLPVSVLCRVSWIVCKLYGLYMFMKGSLAILRPFSRCTPTSLQSVWSS